jgi:hypothetical protein
MSEIASPPRWLYHEVMVGWHLHSDDNFACRKEWAARLDALRAIREQFPGGPVWLWNLRIRILQFLVARYGHDQNVETEKRDSAAFGETNDSANDSEWRWSGISLPPVARAGIENPPRTREELATKLLQISDGLDACRSSTWQRPPVETIWTWWRDVYACSR